MQKLGKGKKKSEIINHKNIFFAYFRKYLFSDLKFCFCFREEEFYYKIAKFIIVFCK